jgi:AAHS family 4-hydroxybenzoate transporter-like MFS transporter
MGGAGPIAITIASDYCPKRVRAALTMVMYTGFSIGGVFAGAVNAYFLRYGWQTVFYVGGAIPILLSPVLILALPESLNYLVSRKTRGAEIAVILARLAPGTQHSADSRFVMDQAYEKKIQVPELFRTGLGRRTILLWTIIFVSLVTLFSLTNWLPTLFNSLGITPKQVVTIMAVSQGAGLLGSLVAARLVVSNPPFHVAALGYAFAATLLLSLAKFGSGYAAIILVNPLLYFFLIGDQNIVNAMAGQLYPPKIRATGTGWGIGIGRIGGILGPSIAGLLLAFHWTPSRLFMLAAFPTLATAAAALALSRVMKQLPGDSRSADFRG